MHVSKTALQDSSVSIQSSVNSCCFLFLPADNQLNGVFCSENEPLWRMVRDEWKFRGSVITDWCVDKHVSFFVYVLNSCFNIVKSFLSLVAGELLAIESGVLMLALTLRCPARSTCRL